MVEKFQGLVCTENTFRFLVYGSFRNSLHLFPVKSADYKTLFPISIVLTILYYGGNKTEINIQRS